ncbi:hypothetical protein ABPG75_001294 [Micractinium tetrahymenae]
MPPLSALPARACLPAGRPSQGKPGRPPQVAGVRQQPRGSSPQELLHPTGTSLCSPCRAFLQYYVDGFLWHTTAPRPNRPNWDFDGGASLSRIAASGAVYWQETCGPAAGVRVLLYDEDITSGGLDDFMGSTTTGIAGNFSINLNPLKVG